MTSLARISALLFNPVALLFTPVALLFNPVARLFNPVALAAVTSSLGLGVSLLENQSHAIQTPAAVESAPTQRVLAETTCASNWATVEPPRTLTPSEQKLAQSFAAAMSGHPNVVRSVTSIKKPEPTEQIERTWVCGNWEDLVQGRGQARTCEWR